MDICPGQPLQSNQSSGSLGVFGRRSASDLGAIGDIVNPGGMHDQLYNLQVLEAAYYKLPQPRDSERPKFYNPVWMTHTLYFYLILAGCIDSDNCWSSPFTEAPCNDSSELSSSTGTNC